MASEQPAVPAQEKPKRPVGGAFGRFLAENRAAFAKETPKCSEQCKIAGRRFKELGEAEKAEWQAKFEQATAQYERDMQAWREAGGEELEKKRKADEEAGKAEAKKRKDTKKAAREEAKRNRAKDSNATETEAMGASPSAREPREAEGEESPGREPLKAEAAGHPAAEGAAACAAPAAAGSAEGAKKRGRPRKEDSAKPVAAPKYRVPLVAPGGPKWPAGGAVGRYLDKHRRQLNEECKGQPGLKASRLAQERFEKLSDEEKKPFEDEHQRMLEEYHAAAKRAPANGTAPVPATGIMGALVRGQGSAKRATDGAGQEAETPPAKLPRAAAEASREGGSSKKAPAAQGKSHGKALPAAGAAVELEKDIADEAEKAGLTNVLQKFLAHKDVAASGRSQAEALRALQTAAGLVHPARRVLLGA